MGSCPTETKSGLLDLDVAWVETQADASVATEMCAIRTYADAYGDDYRSLTNLCHQLRSLDRLWSLLQLFQPAQDDIVLLLRPDLLYLDRLDPARDLAPLTGGQSDIVVPAWQSWGGLNDRFALCTARTAQIYVTRFRLAADACAEMRGLHAEGFLQFVIACHGLRVSLTDLRGVRLRADGRVAGNDRAMLAAAGKRAA